MKRFLLILLLIVITNPYQDLDYAKINVYYLDSECDIEVGSGCDESNDEEQQEEIPDRSSAEKVVMQDIDKDFLNIFLKSK